MPHPLLSTALLLLIVGAVVLSPPARAAEMRGATAITVHKTPWCGCCNHWVDHLRSEGFSVTVHDHQDLTPVKQRLDIPPTLASCHTAEVEGYAVEGHVPASDIRRLLDEQPDGARGLAVPGMPAGSPGMEMGDIRDPYDVIVFGEAGQDVFTEYRPE